MKFEVKKLQAGEEFPKEAERFLLEREYTHLWQSPVWFKFRNDRNIDFSTYILYREQKVVACTQIIYPRVLKVFNYAYVSRGPVWDQSSGVFAQLLDTIRKDTQDRDCLFVKLDPTLLQFTREELEIIKMRGGDKQQRRVIPSGTAHVDVSGEKEQVLGTFSKKTRYSIRKAYDSGVEVVHGNTDDDYQQYLAIIEKTEQRQKFKQREPGFFKTLLETYNYTSPVHLLLIRYKGTYIAGGIFVEYQNRLHYLSGGFDDDYKHVQGASVLMYEAMNLAHSLRLTHFDFFSYSSGESKEFISIDKFKDSFNPYIDKWEDGIDIPIRKSLYKLYRLIS